MIVGLITKYFLHFSELSILQYFLSLSVINDIVFCIQIIRMIFLVRDEIWIFLRQGQMFKLMLTDTNDIVYLTAPPPNAFRGMKSLPKPTTTQPKQDKLSLRKVSFFV